MYRQDRQPYLDRDGQVDQEWADEKWQQWCERDFHPAVEAYNDYNNPDPEMIVLKSLNENLRSEDDALKRVQIRLSQVQRTLGLSIHSSGLHDSDHLLVQSRDLLNDIFEDIDIHLRTANQARGELKEQLKSLQLAAKLLIRSRTASEKTKKKRDAEDEKMVDTVKFLKECLDNHCRLVNLVLGRPEPLVQQGTDLVQAMLSEMFGLPIEESIAEVPEPEIESILEEEVKMEAESEIEVLWEKTESESDMDTDQDEPESNADTSDSYPKLIPARSADKSRLRQRAKHEKERAALYKRFGLSVISTSAADQEEATEMERNKVKCQKKMMDTLEKSPGRNRSLIRQRPALKQTMLSFNKVRKSRRLFSRKELSQIETVEHQEESEVASPGSLRRNPRRATVKHADYRDDFEAWNEKMFGPGRRY